MGHLPKLELMRVAVNNIEKVSRMQLHYPFSLQTMRECCPLSGMLSGCLHMSLVSVPL